MRKKELRHNKKFYDNLRLTVSEEELDQKKKLKRLAYKNMYTSLEHFKFFLSSARRSTFDTLLDQRLANIRAHQLSVHNEKLRKLGIAILPINDQLVNKKSNKLDEREIKQPELVFNLSTRELTTVETKVFGKGLSFGIRAKRVDEYELRTRFKCLAQSLNRIASHEKHNDLHADLNS